MRPSYFVALAVSLSTFSARADEPAPAPAPAPDPAPVTRAEAKLRVVNKAGIHARASVRFVQLARKFHSKVIVTKVGDDGEERDGKEIDDVLLLIARQGEEIIVRCEGDDAEACLKALSELVKDGFGEE